MDMMEKKYGIWTSTAMVVGVVIGSGVFFKADDVLILTNGNLLLALVAWVIGALSMIFGALVFAEFSQRIEKANGIVDYSEEAYGKRFGYLVGWFKGIVYYSPISAILAWVSALYTLVLLGSDNPDNSGLTWGLAFVYMSLGYLLNYYRPILSGKFQVTTTIIKLIPLILIAVYGIIIGLTKGVMIDNFETSLNTVKNGNGSLSTAVVATAFAFEGWIVATTINSEIKDAKKTLPMALTIGAFVVFVVYITYFLGIAGVLQTDSILREGNNSVNIASRKIFGQFGAVLLTLFVVISCMGTLNGLVISVIRTHYSLALRNQGPMPKLLSKINPKTKMPLYSVIYGYCISLLYLFIWYGSLNNFFGQYIGIDEIPIVLIYGLYIFLYIWYMFKFKDLSFIRRFLIPIFAIIGSCIILYGGLTNPSIGLYLLLSLMIIIVGLVFYRRNI